MKTTLILALAASVLACAASHNGSDAASSSSTAAGQLFRYVDGDNIVIHSDWSADANGYHLSPVIDGEPNQPWISNEHYDGSHWIAFQTPDQTMSDHKERIEYKLATASDSDGLHFDNSRYTGFAFMLDKSAQPFQSSVLFWQAWQGYPWGPPAMLKFVKRATAPYRIGLAIRNDQTGPDSSQPDQTTWSEDLIVPGTWYTFVIFLKPSYAGKGEIKLWLNGELKVDWTGDIGYDPAGTKGALDGLDLKFGNYQPDPNYGHTLYFDNVKLADTYELARP